jgi:hypothetical protein
MILTVLLFWLQLQTPVMERLYAFSGLDARIANIPTLLTLQAEQQFEGSPLPDAGKLLFEKMLRSFNVDSLMRDARIGFASNPNAELAKAVDVWLAEPKTKQIHTLLLRPLDEAMVTQLDAHFASESQIPGEERVQALIQLDERMRTSEIEAMVIVNVYLSFVTVMNDYLPQEERISDEDMPEIAHLMHTDLYKAYQGANLGRLAYLLRDVSDTDIQKFSAGYASPAGMWFADLAKSTTEHVLERIGVRIDASL